MEGGEKSGGRADVDASANASVLDSSSGVARSAQSRQSHRSRDDDPHDPAAGDLSDEHTAVVGGVVLRAAMGIAAGAVLGGRYQIEAPLGEGGSGMVYRAWDRMVGELVAVKILHPQRARERSWIKRLAREVRVARAIRHPNVCRVFELGHAEGHWFVTMELATGGSLRDLLRTGRAESDARANANLEASASPAGATRTISSSSVATDRALADRLRDIRELCAGLGAIHAVGITHRDVTPQNVLRMADGRLVITDFGLAIERDDQTTVHGGTPAYMPPEAARGERSDQRSDVFQLGMIMHEVLTGVRPTWSSDGARLALADPRPGASVVEEELLRLVAECVDADPAKRPPSAIAVAGRLAAAEVARPAPFPIRVVTRVRRSMRRHARLMAVAGASLALAGIVRTVQIVSRPPLCRGAAQQLAGIWDGPRAEAVRRAFVASGKSYADDAYGRVRSILDAYAVDWQRMYTDACEATHLRGEQSADVLDLRMACLKDGQGELRALTDLFSSADGEVVSRSISAASAMTPIERCADVAVLKAVIRPPDNRQTRAEVDRLREGLSEVKALYGAGRLVEGVRRATPIVAEARTVGYAPVLAESLEALGRLEVLSKPFAEAATVLDEAMLVAEASRHDRMLAEAAVDKVSLLGAAGRIDDENAFVPRAEATLKRIGGDQRLQSWIYAGVGQAYALNGRYAEALVMHQKALDAKRAVLPPDHWDVALSLGSVAVILHELGRDREALEQNERSIAILAHALGPRHPDLALHVYNRGEIRLALGQVGAARDDFQQALSIWKDELPASHLYNSYPLTGIGLAVLADGRSVHDAIEPLEQALAIRDQAAAAPAMRAETMFALARALWLAGPIPARDHARAIVLAEGARDLFGTDKPDDRRKVDDALTLWRSPARKSVGLARAQGRSTDRSTDRDHDRDQHRDYDRMHDRDPDAGKIHVAGP